MSLDFLPPQAYTKETLLKAYNWLQSQSEQVKELATTPDQLVSLYLRSYRNGGQETVQRYSQNSAQNVSTASPTQNSAQPTPQTTPSVSPTETGDRPSLQNFKSELKNLAGLMGDLEKPAPQPPPAPVYQAPQPPVQQAAPTNAYVSSPVQVSGYDEMTLNLIREVKNELNLSSDIEALRMLVKIGYQKVRSLYK